MSKRSQRPDPNDPTQWIGQPYAPHDPYYYVTGQGRFRFPVKSFYLYGFLLLLGGCAITWIALIAVGIIQTTGLGFWALLALIAAAIIGILAGTLSARRRRQASAARQPHHHHKAR